MPPRAHSWIQAKAKAKGRRLATQRPPAGLHKSVGAIACGILKKNPLCAECKKRGILTPATDVDHVIAHRGDMTEVLERGKASIVQALPFTKDRQRSEG